MEILYIPYWVQSIKFKTYGIYRSNILYCISFIKSIEIAYYDLCVATVSAPIGRWCWRVTTFMFLRMLHAVWAKEYNTV